MAEETSPSVAAYALRCLDVLYAQIREAGDDGVVGRLHDTLGKVLDVRRIWTGAWAEIVELRERVERLEGRVLAASDCHSPEIVAGKEVQCFTCRERWPCGTHSALFAPPDVALTAKHPIDLTPPPFTAPSVVGPMLAADEVLTSVIAFGGDEYPVLGKGVGVKGNTPYHFEPLFNEKGELVAYWVVEDG